MTSQEYKPREFWIWNGMTIDQMSGINPNDKIHVIEYSALEYAQKEIEELKDSNENIRSHLLSQTKISNQLLNEKEQLTAALKVAEDALVKYKDSAFDIDGKIYKVGSKAAEALSEIKKIKGDA